MIETREHARMLKVLKFLTALRISREICLNFKAIVRIMLIALGAEPLTDGCQQKTGTLATLRNADVARAGVLSIQTLGNDQFTLSGVLPKIMVVPGMKAAAV
jgi:hypothetical protein